MDTHRTEGEDVQVEQTVGASLEDVSLNPLPPPMQGDATPDPGIAASLSRVPTAQAVVSPERLPPVMPTEVTPSANAGNEELADGESEGSSLVYALGELGYDFGTHPHRDAFEKHLSEFVEEGVRADPDDAAQMGSYMEKYPQEAASVIWTLNLDDVPIYAIVPTGPYAHQIYERLREFLGKQLTSGDFRISVPGILSAGSATLLSQQQVPIIVPDPRGMYHWGTEEFGTRCRQEIAKVEKEGEREPPSDDAITNFLHRVFYELRNLGQSPEERAMNFAATDLRMSHVFHDEATKGRELDAIEVEATAICRPGSDCWDVKLRFFDPTRRLEAARSVYRLTVDVSHTLPVTVGKVQGWRVY